MRVAWVAPFNLGLLQHRVPVAGRRFHPAPWIMNGLRALNRTGEVELHVVTYAKDLDRDYEFDEEGMRFHVLRPDYPRVPRALVLYQLDLSRFQEVLRRIGPDLVHGHGTENIFSLAAVRSGYPHVISMQAVMSELLKTQRRFSRTFVHFALVCALERRTLKLATHALVEAPFVADIIARVNRRIQTRVVGNIVSASYFQVVRRPDVARPRILFVGSLVREKGVGEAILAFHWLALRWPALELHVVGAGEGAYVASLRELAAGGPGASRIAFRGFLAPEAIATEHAEATMVVAPTYYDTSPNVVAEAMVAGVPVIASDVGGLPYMLESGDAGLLVPARDPVALAGAIERNLTHPANCLAAATRGQWLARSRYSAETFVTSVMAAYRDALGASARARR